eukprot:11396554-Ditylum_brightwellii.AAC.1
MAMAESASLEEGIEISNNKTNNKTNTPALQEQNDAEEGDGVVSGGEVDCKSRQGKEGMYKLYPNEGILGGCPFFLSVDEGYTAFSRLKSAEQKAFDPTGFLLAVKLSLYKDEESPYVYKQYFHGVLKKDFLASYCVLEVGDRANIS